MQINQQQSNAYETAKFEVKFTQMLMKQQSLK
jgi:hypothetical protein